MKTIKTKPDKKRLGTGQTHRLPQNITKRAAQAAQAKMRDIAAAPEAAQEQESTSPYAQTSQQIVEETIAVGACAAHSAAKAVSHTVGNRVKERTAQNPLNAQDASAEQPPTDVVSIKTRAYSEQPRQQDMASHRYPESPKQQSIPSQPNTSARQVSAPTAAIKSRAAQTVKTAAPAIKTKEATMPMKPTAQESTVSHYSDTQMPASPEVKTAAPTIKIKEANMLVKPTAQESTVPRHSDTHMSAAPEVRNQQKVQKAAYNKVQHMRAASAKPPAGAAKDMPVEAGKKAAAKHTVKTRGTAAVKTMHSAIKLDARGIKTAAETAAKAKRAEKAAQQAARRAAHTAKVITKKAVQTAKVVAKAIVSAIKGFILAMKSLVAAIAALSGTAVVIILLVSLVAIIAGSVLGIFMAAKPSGHGEPVAEVTSALNEEYYRQISQIQARIEHDKVEIRASDGLMGVKWEDVLAVYACKLAASDTPSEVVTFDAQKKAILRSILWDMNAVNYTTRVETKYIDVPVLDEDGNPLYGEDGKPLTEKEAYTETTLIITVSHKTPDEMAVAYGFTQKQYTALALLKESEYATLWAKLLGGLVNGGGEIITPDTDWTGTDAFSWPLPKSFSITSRYGYRKDPFTGKVSFHSGTDISAPFGTPILAAAGGTVTVANSTDPWGMSYGYHVKINHGGGQETLYAHCSSICVTPGQQVQAGEVIGYVGSTGNSTGNHLHFEVRINGQTTDAMQYFS